MSNIYVYFAHYLFSHVFARAGKRADNTHTHTHTNTHTHTLKRIIIAQHFDVL